VDRALSRANALAAKLRDLQQRIRRRSKAGLTDREARAAIEQGRP
jgi:hypothetical protein